MIGSNFSRYEFGNRIALRRKECGFKSQAALAERFLSLEDNTMIYDRKIESKRKAISNWEKGDSEPSVSDFLLLCQFLECDPEYLFGIIDVPRKEVKTAMEIIGLSEDSIKKLIRFKNETEYCDVISVLLEDFNAEYLLYLIQQRFLYSTQPVKPILKDNSLINAKEYHKSVIDKEIKIPFDNALLVAKKKNLLDSLINTAFIDGMKVMAEAYQAKKEERNNG